MLKPEKVAEEREDSLSLQLMMVEEEEEDKEEEGLK